MTTIRLLIHTNQPLLARGLASLDLEREGIVVVRTCSALAETRASLRALDPDVVLLDLTEDMTLAALSELRRIGGRCRILLWAQEIPAELAFQAVSAGIRGLLRKTAGSEQVIDCLHRIHGGELCFDKELTDRILTARRVVLTKREAQIVALLAQGLKNKEIAATLMLSEGTVKVYISKLFQKLGARGRVEVALQGRRNLLETRAAGNAALWNDGAAFAPRTLMLPCALQ